MLTLHVVHRGLYSLASAGWDAKIHSMDILGLKDEVYGVSVLNSNRTLLSHDYDVREGRLRVWDIDLDIDQSLAISLH